MAGHPFTDGTPSPTETQRTARDETAITEPEIAGTARGMNSLVRQMNPHSDVFHTPAPTQVVRPALAQNQTMPAQSVQAQSAPAQPVSVQPTSPTTTSKKRKRRVEDEGLGEREESVREQSHREPSQRERSRTQSVVQSTEGEDGDLTIVSWNVKPPTNEELKAKKRKEAAKKREEEAAAKKEKKQKDARSKLIKILHKAALLTRAKTTKQHLKDAKDLAALPKEPFDIGTRTNNDWLKLLKITQKQLTKEFEDADEYYENKLWRKLDEEAFFEGHHTVAEERQTWIDGAVFEAGVLARVLKDEDVDKATLESVGLEY
ncbi:hypothetical protein MBLNU230_g3022t1 [Neophaeotheca triangularis]